VATKRPDTGVRRPQRLARASGLRPGTIVGRARALAHRDPNPDTAEGAPLEGSAVMRGDCGYTRCCSAPACWRIRGSRHRAVRPRVYRIFTVANRGYPPNLQGPARKGRRPSDLGGRFSVCRPGGPAQDSILTGKRPERPFWFHAHEVDAPSAVPVSRSGRRRNFVAAVARGSLRGGFLRARLALAVGPV